MILLDTHPLIWFMQGMDRLGGRAQKIIQSAIEENSALVSPISFWETAMLARKGRISLGRDVALWARGIVGNGVKIAELTVQIAIRAGELPEDIHGDPADRLIIATAGTLDCALLTADRKILACAKAGYLKAIDARR